MNELVDTHCHIQSAGAGGLGERSTREKWSKADRSPADIIDKAQKSGVTRMICVGCDLADSKLAIGFIQDRPGTWASIGLHPHEAVNYAGNKLALQEFAALAGQDKVVAIGECGLDYFYGHSPEKDQAEVLRYQMELALRYDLPMIFHVRDAFEDFWPIFDTLSPAGSPIRGVLHSFTDNEANLNKAIDRGLYIGVNGIVTFTKDEKQLEMYKKMPLSRLLLETDAPFLTPTPYRGKICEPYHIEVIADFLGGLRQEAVSDLAAATTENAQKLFKIT